MSDVFSIIKTTLYANVLILYRTTVEKTSMQRQKKYIRANEESAASHLRKKIQKVTRSGTSHNFLDFKLTPSTSGLCKYVRSTKPFLARSLYVFVDVLQHLDELFAPDGECFCSANVKGD